MNCRRVSRWLSAYIEGDLAPHQTARMEDHLKVCHACRDKLDDFKLIIRTAGELEKRAPGPFFMNRVLCALGSNGRPVGLLTGWKFRLALSGMSFVTAAAITFLWFGPPTRDLRHGRNLPMANSASITTDQDSQSNSKAAFPVSEDALKRDMAWVESLKTDSVASESIAISNRYLQHVDQPQDNER